MRTKKSSRKTETRGRKVDIVSGLYNCELYYPETDTRETRPIWLFDDGYLPPHVVSLDQTTIQTFEESKTRAQDMDIRACEDLVNAVIVLAVKDATSNNVYSDEAKRFCKYGSNSRLARLCKQLEQQKAQMDTESMYLLLDFLSNKEIEKYLNSKGLYSYQKVREAYRYAKPEDMKYCKEVKSAIAKVQTNNMRQREKMKYGGRRE